MIDGLGIQVLDGGRRRYRWAALARVNPSGTWLRHIVHRSDDLRTHLLEALLASATDYAILALDLGGRVVLWNEGARSIMGWSEAEMLEQPVHAIFTEEDRRDRIPEAEMRAAAETGTGTDERWHLRRDGSRFWANGEMMPMRDGTGAHLGYMKILRDRTAQRLEAERQRADAEFLRSVLASSADCIIILDLDGNTRFVSPGGIEAMELSDVDAIIGLSWPRVWKGDDQAAAVSAIATARGGGVGRFRGFCPTHNGTPKWWDVAVSPMAGPDGLPEGLVSIARDVTDQHGTEAALRETEERRRLAVEAADIGTWSFDVDTLTPHWDDRCRALAGLPADKAVTHKVYMANIHPDDRERVQALTEAALDPSGSGAYRAEYRVVGPVDGVERWISAAGRARFHEGRAVFLAGTARDVTVRKRAEEQTRLLADELQHRVKNTLAMVQAIVRQTLRTAETPVDAQAAIEPRLAALGRAHARLTGGGWEGSDLREAAISALEPYDDGSGRLRLSGPLVRLPPQAAMSLALMLNELATNAVKYGALSTAEGGVDLSWSVETSPEPRQSSNLHLVWREHGGPPVDEPAGRGFGSKLIERGLASAIGGVATLTFAREGVTCRVQGTLAALHAPKPRG